MIDREPIICGANDGRRPNKPVPRYFGAGCGTFPWSQGCPRRWSGA